MPKNKFRNIYLLFILGWLFLIVSLPLIEVRAQAGSIPNPIGTTDFLTLAQSIANWLATIGLAVAVIMIVYAALLFMTAGGNEEKITKARKTLTWSLIGIAVLLLAAGGNIIAIIKDVLGI